MSTNQPLFSSYGKKVLYTGTEFAIQIREVLYMKFLFYMYVEWQIILRHMNICLEQRCAIHCSIKNNVDFSLSTFAEFKDLYYYLIGFYFVASVSMRTCWV